MVEGRFERITWEEATTLLHKICNALPSNMALPSRFVSLSTGVTGGIFSGANMLRRLFNLTGGFLELSLRDVMVTPLPLPLYLRYSR